MASYNHCTLMGHVCRDAELKFTPSGLAIASISLAVNRTWRDANGEKKEEVSFFDCTAFGKTAEVAGQYVKKGNPLLVAGRLKQETWQDKQTNQNRSKVVLIVETLQLMGGKRDGDQDPSGPTPPRTGAPSQAAPAPEEDDVPF